MIPIPLLLANWRLIALGAALLGVGGYVWMCERAKDELVASKAIAEQQAVQNAKQAFRDLKAKERSDENYERRIARLAVDLERLRNASPSNLPTAAPGPAGTPTVTFDRSELDAALRSYRDEVARGRAEIRGIVGEGAAAVEALDTAKEWAGSQ